jgi:hypothetical protein
LQELGVPTRIIQRYKVILDQRYDIKLLKLSNNGKKHPIEMTNEQYNSWEGNENEKKEKEI